MKDSDKQLAELMRLFSALEADALTEQESALLDSRLGSCEQARACFRDFIALHEDLRRMPLEALEQLGSNTLACVKEFETRPAATEQPRLPMYLVATIGGLAACLAVAGFFLTERNQPGRDDAVASRSEVVTLSSNRSTHYVASLIEATDAQWKTPETPPSAGTRLSKGRFELLAGRAFIRFDSGGALNLTGPVCVDITSNSSATLNSGRVVFISDGSDLHFTLSTPNSRLMHFGTEYAVCVGIEREEIHVLDGEVHRLVGDEVSGRLVAGEARQFGPNTSEEIELLPSLFASATAAQAPDDSDEDRHRDPIAIERFNYELGSRFAEESTSGGEGWRGPWWLSEQLPQRPGKIKKSSDLADWGRYCRCEGNFLACRFLESPIGMDRDGLAYVSYRFRFPAVKTTNDMFSSTVLLVLRARPFLDTPFYKEGVRMMTHRSFLVVSRNNDFSRLETQIRPRVEHVFVGKIVCSKEGPDQLFARVFPADEPLPRHEPTSWSVVGPEFRSDEVLERITLQVAARGGKVALDDLVIGKTWQSIIAPVQRSGE